MEQATFFKKRRGEIRFKTFSYRVLSFILTIVGLAFFFAAMLDHLQQVVPLVKAISLGNEQAWQASLALSLFSAFHLQVTATAVAWAFARPLFSLLMLIASIALTTFSMVI